MRMKPLLSIFLIVLAALPHSSFAADGDYCKYDISDMRAERQNNKEKDVMSPSEDIMNVVPLDIRNDNFDEVQHCHRYLYIWSQ